MIQANPFGYGKAIVSFAIFLIFFILISIFLQALFYLNYINAEFLKLLLSLTFLFPSGIVLIFFRTKIPFKLKENFFIYILLLPLALSIQVLGTALMILFLDFFPEKYISYYEELQNFLMPKSNLDFLFTIISIGIVGPFCEELIFRGIILSKLIENKKNLTISNIFQSILFAVAHMNPVQFFYAIPIGIFFGWIYIKSKNLLLPILIHIFTNVSAILLLTIPLDNSLWKTLQKFGSETTNFQELPKEPIYISFIIVFLFYYLIKKNYKYFKYS
ncbi:MAG: lysostaphin resistance A-like protein [Leptonema sp. (in: bacteria)]